MSGQYMSVPQFYTVKGLEVLAELATAAGRTDDAKKCTREATALRSSIVKHMWDPKARRFCDGICADPRIGGNHSIYSDMYSLWLGLVPADGGDSTNLDSVWQSTTSWGSEYTSNPLYLCDAVSFPTVCLCL
jgi:glycogen debranching enzyme